MARREATGALPFSARQAAKLIAVDTRKKTSMIDFT
jgi:hypothetical protein